MDILPLILLLIAGCAAGYLAGYFGVGGGIILVPVLLYLYQSSGVTSLVSTHLAFGTSLLVVAFAALASTYEHHRNGQVLWRVAAFIAAGGIVGALLGALLAANIPGALLRKIFAVVVLFAVIRLLTQPRKPKNLVEPPLMWLRLLATGLVTGFLSSLAGVGGGLISIPIMYSLLKFPLKKSTGTSNAALVATALAAAIGYGVAGWGTFGLPTRSFGYVDWVAAIPLIIGSLPMAKLGAAAAEKIPNSTLRKIFAVLLVAVAAKMFLG